MFLKLESTRHKALIVNTETITYVRPADSGGCAIFFTDGEDAPIYVTASIEELFELLDEEAA